MESSGSDAGSHILGQNRSEQWKLWARIAEANAFKGACTAVGTGAVSLLIWWAQGRCPYFVACSLP